MDFASFVERLDSIDISPNEYRTAVRLFKGADPTTGALVLAHADLCAIAGKVSEDRARAQLITFQKLGILTYKRNSHVQVWFANWQPQSDRLRTEGDHQAIKVITTRAPEPEEARQGDHHTRELITTRAPQGAAQADEAPAAGPADAPSDHHTRELITTRANRAPRDQLPHTGASACGVSLLVDPDPPSSEGSNKQTNKHAPPGNGDSAGHEPFSADQVAAVALLTDPDVGMAPGPARKFAATPGLGFERIAAHVFEWRRQLDKGVVRSVGALVKRLENPQEFSAVIIAADRRTDLWRRHMPEPDEGADSYLPAGYDPPAGPILRPPDPDPEPQPGTPDHAWWQVRREAQTEQGGSFARWLDGTHVIAHDAAANQFTVAVTHPHALDWLRSRMARQINRKLTVITGRPAAVEFQAQAQGD